MVTRNPKINGLKLETMISAWERLKPTKSFGGMTLEDFKIGVQPSLDAREMVKSLEDQLLSAQNIRDDADKVSMEKAQMVIRGVLGDPGEGPDSHLYEAMGYVRKSEKKTGLTHKKKAVKPAKAES